MNKNSVVLKGNKYGIVVVIAEDAGFEEIKTSIIEKFKESAKFFGRESMAIAFEGKKLSDSQPGRNRDGSGPLSPGRRTAVDSDRAGDGGA